MGTYSIYVKGKKVTQMEAKNSKNALNTYRIAGAHNRRGKDSFLPKKSIKAKRVKQ